MKIAVIHNTVTNDDGPDEKDVLLQAEVVTSALISQGHKVIRLGCTLDLETMRQKLADIKPQLVFNLVESLGGYGSLIDLFPNLLDALGISYTGSKAESIRQTSNKTAAKKCMRRGGLPTPDWLDSQAEPEKLGMAGPFLGGRTWIIKALWEHASIGLDENSIVEAESFADLLSRMTNRSAALGTVCFAEEFIPGREFNLSLLAGKNGKPKVLPPAEICFEGFDPDKPWIVDYRAKWEEDSFEYRNTPRSFDFRTRDHSLLRELEGLALRSWEVFGLRGYARVDFRVDAENRPWILEVNANPCLSPDAGFAAALSRAGISFKNAVKAIIVDSFSAS